MKVTFTTVQTDIDALKEKESIERKQINARISFEKTTEEIRKKCHGNF